MMTKFSPAHFTRGLEVSGVKALNHALTLPAADRGEYELKDHEMKRLRARIYDVNKYHPRGYKFRTIREGSKLMIWRVK